MKKLEDFIKLYPESLDDSLCDAIINQKDLNFFTASTGGGEIKKDYRNCYAKKLDDQFTTDVYEAVSKVLKKYNEDIPSFTFGNTIEDTGYDHLLYIGKNNGFYKEHVDHFDLQPRLISISFLLNDNFKGGEFAFFGGEYKIPKKIGSALIFPNNFCYPHAVLPVSGGDRHAVITWVH